MTADYKLSNRPKWKAFRVLRKERRILFTVFLIAVGYIITTALIMFNLEDSEMFGSFFDALYCSDSRAHLESCLKKISFLGFTCTVHKRIVDPLKKVNDEIMALAKTDNETKSFVNSLTSAEAYFWRIIAGTKRKSFHSLGIAVDIRPKRLNGKAIFWSWTKDKEPENWMLTPLAKRWIPPQKVLDIFERNGFIWGGKWIIFDNMHFEYHPELIEFNGIIQNQESAETNTGVSTTQN